LNPVSFTNQPQPSPEIQPILDEILTTKSIPALNPDQISILTHYLYNLPTTGKSRDLRVNIAEIAYLNYQDPQALDLYLACTIRFAQRMAERKAYRVFVHPTDWQLEAMYDGAVRNLLQMFNAQRTLNSTIPNAFRRYLMRSIGWGTMYLFHIRQENWDIEGVEDLSKFPSVQDRRRNPVEQDVIARDLLEQVITFPYLSEEQSRMLKAIAALGPEKALRHDSCYWKNGRHEPRSKQIRRRRAMLDLDTLAATMGIDKIKLQSILKQSREILRGFFDRDGRLFTGD
jgi:hypothetical protein